MLRYISSLLTFVIRNRSQSITDYVNYKVVVYLPNNNQRHPQMKTILV